MPAAPLSEAALLDAARRALTHWKLAAADVRLVARSENVVFRVDAPDGHAYVLRIHRPGYNSRAELESEHVWMTALNASGIDAPRALRTVGGDGYVPVALPDGSSRFAGVVEWVEGELLSAAIAQAHDERAIAARFESLGSIAARIHNQSSGWQLPADFVRRAWDADGLMGEQPLWGRFWDVPQLDAAGRALLLRTRDAIHRELRAFGTGSDRYSLIHADLHAHNVLVAGDRLAVIDFDDSGFGWHLHELAVALFSEWREPPGEAATAALLAGYRRERSLPAEHERLLPMFVLIRALALIGWMHDRPELGQVGRIERLIERTTADCEAFLSGRVGG
ncbi:MAG: phosphotransferase [Chloroflexi bacterium]|nr:phosphotransferase [Chloroflexota bacterium]